MLLICSSPHKASALFGQFRHQPDQSSGKCAIPYAIASLAHSANNMDKHFRENFTMVCQKQCTTTRFAACLLLLVWTFVCVRPVQTQGSKYVVHYPDSYLLAITGKSGVFSFAAHKHAILATQWSSDIKLDRGHLTQSTFTVTVPVSSLVIDSHEARQKAGLGSGPSESDVRKIQIRMLSPEVLDVEHHPLIRLNATSIEIAGPEHLRVAGTMEINGQSRQVTIPMRYKPNQTGGFNFYGDFTVSQTNFGMQPEKVGGGTVKVKDEVTIRFQISVVPQS